MPARELHELLDDRAREREARGVDVDEGEGARVEVVDGQEVGDDLTGEDGAAGADHRHLGHFESLAPVRRATSAPPVSYFLGDDSV